MLYKFNEWLVEHISQPIVNRLPDGYTQWDCAKIAAFVLTLSGAFLFLIKKEYYIIIGEPFIYVSLVTMFIPLAKRTAGNPNIIKYNFICSILLYLTITLLIANYIGFAFGVGNSLRLTLLTMEDIASILFYLFIMTDNPKPNLRQRKKSGIFSLQGI